MDAIQPFVFPLILGWTLQEDGLDSKMLRSFPSSDFALFQQHGLRLSLFQGFLGLGRMMIDEPTHSFLNPKP